MRNLMIATAGALALATFAGCGGDPMADVKREAAKYAPEKTAARIQANYHKRGIPGRVSCTDFSADEQRCVVREHGQVVMRLDVKLNLSTGAIDVAPRPAS